MSMVRLIVRDEKRSLYADQHGGFAASVIAALSDDPDTIEELEHALRRFIAPKPEGYFHLFSVGVDDEPYDAGLVVVDLAARLVACESTYLSAEHRAMLYYHNGEHLTDIAVPYTVSQDWKFQNDTMGWDCIADERREERLKNRPTDIRVVLYGLPLLEFIAREALAVFHDRPAPAFDDQKSRNEEYDLVKGIHERWLMTPREDLGGKTPRELMLKDQDHVDHALSDRKHPWSQTNKRPPGIRPDSAAYRFTGPGTHELVVYYDLVRELIEFCRDRVRDDRPADHNAFIEFEVDRLRAMRDRWLDANYSETGERPAREIIDMERRRLPWGVTGAEAMVDDDCPVCQMMAEDSGPYFWNLDGCNMDQDFAFSFHKTLEEWEEEQEEYREMDRRHDAEEEERKRLGVDYDRETSGASCDLMTSRVLEVGRSVCGVIVEIRESGLEQALVGRLTQAFAELREAASSLSEPIEDEGVGSRLDRLSAIVSEVVLAGPKKPHYCERLQDLLERFLIPPRPIEPFGELTEDDMPF